MLSSIVFLMPCFWIRRILRIPARNRLSVLAKVTAGAGSPRSVPQRSKNARATDRPGEVLQGEQPAGIVHALVFWGFLILGLQVATMFLAAARRRLPAVAQPRTCSAARTCSSATSWKPSSVLRGYLLVRWLITHPQRLMGFAPAEDAAARPLALGSHT